MGIILTGDIQRPVIQKQNIHRLHSIINPPIKMLTKKDLIKFNTARILTDTEYLKENITNPTVIQFQSENPKEKIWINFEANFNFVKQANAANIKYLDVWVDPIRCLDYLLFSIKTNILDLTEFKYDMDVETKLFKERLKTLKYSPLEKPTTLIIGQTSQDKSVLKEGRYWSLDDFHDEISELTNDNNQILYKPHPAASNKQFKLKNKTIITTTTNTYLLLNDPLLLKVIGLSSSVLKEAELMSKQVYKLFDCWYDTGFVSISPNILGSTMFWSKVLGIEDTYNFTPNFKPNSIRDLFQNKWSYPF